MKSAELPDDSEHKFFVSIANIFGTDANHLDLEFASGVESSLAVDTCLEHILGLLLDVSPVDNLVVDPVDDFTQDVAIAHILIEVVDKHALDSKGIDPESESSLFAGSLDIVVVVDSSLDGFLLLSVEIWEAVLCVEDLGDEHTVYLGVALDDISCADNILTADGSRVVDCDLSAFDVVLLGESIKRALVLVELVQDIDDLLTVGEVLAQVVNLSLSSIPQVPVHPSLEDLFDSELLEVTDLLAFLKEMEEVLAILEVDGLSVDDADKLPGDREDVSVILVQEGLTIDSLVNNHSGAAGEELLQVLSYLKDVEVGSLVDCSEVNDLINLSGDGVWLAALVEEVEADKTVAHDIEKIGVFGVDWQSFLDEFAIFELVVDASGEGTDLFVQIDGDGA